MSFAMKKPSVMVFHQVQDALLYTTSVANERCDILDIQTGGIIQDLVEREQRC